MHLRKLVLVCGFAVTLLANYANALGLGEITLKSSLNQPLNAEIKLLDVRDLTADQIIVALGSPADFERNGVDRLFFYSEFGFEVLLNSPGGAVVRITTRNPVREPFLNFLIEARWSTGRLLREYTLLMDLPTFGDTPTTPVESATSYPQNISQPRASSTVKSPTQAPRNDSAYTPSQATPTPTPAPAQRSGGSRTGSDSYGPVSSSDTLWQIALDVRPDRNLSVHQTMLAIQRLNPEAFINGNINLLRKGQVLRLPSADEIRSVNRSEAVAEVAVQNRDWSEKTMGAQLNASRRETSERRETETVSGRVKLVAPEAEPGSSGQGSGGNNGDGRALESKLAGTLEELDKTRSENSELASRVRDLEEQIETMERLVDVSNEQLRAMQLAASQQSESATSAENITPTDSVTPIESENPQLAPLPEINPESTLGSSNESSMATDPEPVIDTPNNEVVSEPEPVIAEPVTPPVRDVNRIIPAKPKTIVDHLYDNALWIALALLAVLVAVYVVIRRRKENADDVDESGQDDDIFTMPAPVDETYDEDEMLDASVDVEAEDMPLFDEEDLPAEAETGDVVGEADIYIAYGKFDQAEEMLLNGLAKDPQSVDIRLKLLEVYSQTQDIGKFDQYYASLVGIASHGALQRAAELRENIPGAGEFEADLLPASNSSIELASDDDRDDDTLDFGLDDDVYSDSEETSGNQTGDDEFSFDLDLDDEPTAPLSADEALDRESDVGKSASRYDLSFEEELDSEVESEDEFSLDLESDSDLDLEESEEEVATETPSLDDDLGELSFEFDDEINATDAPAQPIAMELEPSEDDDEEFNFDFDDEEPEALAEDDNFSIAAEKAPTAETSEDADEFNIDMDMDDLDLEALDHEMESLDAEFGANDESDFAELDVELDQNFVDEPAFEIDSSSELAAFAEDDSGLEEDVFEQALSDSSAPVANADEMPDIGSMSDDDMDAELDFLADTDEAATKLDLARAYIDMGDADGARDILAEVAHEGNQQQREEAAELLGRIEA